MEGVCLVSAVPPYLFLFLSVRENVHNVWVKYEAGPALRIVLLHYTCSLTHLKVD